MMEIQSMTVKELIERLSQLNPESLVLTRSYEGGMDAVGSIEEVKVVYREDQPWYFGDYDTPDSGESDKPVIEAVYLGK